MKFEDLGLSPEVLKAIADCGYETPTPIQEQAIPIILMARDVVGLAQTGTGKTAGFTLPMIEILAGGRARARMPRSLILEPTRELAAQVAENFDTYGKYSNLSKALLVGGESMGDQQKALEKGVDVLIATPGRLLDLFDRGSILLNDIKVLVIDEADRMLDMGFIPDIEKIVSKIPPIRQTLLFSATMPPEIKKLSDKFLSNPKSVSVAPPASPSETVTQSLVWVPKRQKRSVLKALIDQEDLKNAFIFCNRKREVSELAKWLENKGFNAAPLHGDMPQVSRTATLQRFKDNEVNLLVCSDVAARGLDIDKVSHVFNYDIPMSPEDYVHRIGRTGRAGQKGRAWAIATEDDVKFVKGIETLIGKAIDVVEMDDFDKSDLSEESSGNRNRRGGGRGSSSGGRNRSRSRSGDREPSETRHNPPPKLATRSKDQAPARSRRDDNDDQDGGDRFGDDNMPAFLRR